RSGGGEEENPPRRLHPPPPTPPPQRRHQQFHLLAEPPHHLVALGGVVFQRRLPRPLRDRRHARQRRVDHLAQNLDHARAAHRVAEPPAAHAVRLAEGVRRHALLQHARLGP